MTKIPKTKRQKYGMNDTVKGFCASWAFRGYQNYEQSQQKQGTYLENKVP